MDFLYFTLNHMIIKRTTIKTYNYRCFDVNFHSCIRLYLLYYNTLIMSFLCFKGGYFYFYLTILLIFSTSRTKMQRIQKRRKINECSCILKSHIFSTFLLLFLFLPVLCLRYKPLLANALLPCRLDDMKPR